MKLEKLQNILIGLGGSAILLFLVGKTQSIKFTEHEQYHEYLILLKENDAILNQDLVRSRYELLTSYDVFVKELLKLKQTQSAMKKIPTFIDREGVGEIKQILAANAEMIKEKESLVERFKSENAILKNSLSYLPVLTKELGSNAERRDWNLERTLNDLLYNILLYNLTSDEKIAPAIESKIEQLSQIKDQYGPSDKSLIELAIAHTRAILLHKPQVDALTKKLLELPTKELSDKLYETYEEYYEKALKTANIYRFYTYLFSLTFLGWISYLIIKKLTKARSAALEAARAKSQFLANMSHEIRTPMNGVLGMADLLGKTELNVQQRDFVETIQVSGENLLMLINDILDFSKLEAGKMQLEMVDFDLKEAIENVVELLAGQAQAKGLAVIAWVDRDVPRKLQGDPTRLRQILINLIGNGIKFTTSGEVVVRVAVNSQASTLTDGEIDIRFAVRDTGIGIPPEAVKKLFQSFSQVDASTTRKYGGTGLGLAICKQLVEMMDGEIGVDSEVGVGSTFWFTATLGKSSTPRTAKVREQLKDQRLLMVDGNATYGEFVHYHGSGWGMEVDRATAAAPGMEKFLAAVSEHRPYNIILLDIQMPDIDEILEQLMESDASLSQTRSIAIATREGQEEAQRFLALGFAGYLIKPITESKLLEGLMVAVQGQPQESLGPIPSSILDNSGRQALPSQAEKPAKFAELKILLVEDTPINRKVFINQLQLLGYKADCANNGQEAIDILATNHYDIVFMDCQMPVLDGYSATEQLRQREGKEKHTVVIAMTANAMSGDRAKCIAAGMDDYLTKPVELAALEATLKKWSPKMSPMSTSPVGDRQESQLLSVNNHQSDGPKAPQLPEVVNWKRLKEISYGDREMQRELMEVFVVDAQGYIDEIKEGLSGNDIVKVYSEAHAIKGASGNLGVESMQAVAAELEHQARMEKSLEDAPELLAELENILDAVRSLMKSLNDNYSISQGSEVLHNPPNPPLKGGLS